MRELMVCLSGSSHQAITHNSSGNVSLLIAREPLRSITSIDLLSAEDPADRLGIDESMIILQALNPAFVLLCRCSHLWLFHQTPEANKICMFVSGDSLLFFSLFIEFTWKSFGDDGFIWRSLNLAQFVKDVQLIQPATHFHVFHYGCDSPNKPRNMVLTLYITAVFAAYPELVILRLTLSFEKEKEHT